MSKTPYDILVGEEYTNSNGEKKTDWTRVATCFELDNGGFSGKTKEGLALTGKFVIKKRTPRSQEATDAASDAFNEG